MFQLRFAKFYLQIVDTSVDRGVAAITGVNFPHNSEPGKRNISYLGAPYIQGVFFTGPPLKMTKCQITLYIFPKGLALNT